MEVKNNLCRKPPSNSFKWLEKQMTRGFARFIHCLKLKTPCFSLWNPYPSTFWNSLEKRDLNPQKN